MFCSFYKLLISPFTYDGKQGPVHLRMAIMAPSIETVDEWKLALRTKRGLPGENKFQTINAAHHMLSHQILHFSFWLYIYQLTSIWSCAFLLETCKELRQTLNINIAMVSAFLSTLVLRYLRLLNYSVLLSYLENGQCTA